MKRFEFSKSENVIEGSSPAPGAAIRQGCERSDARISAEFHARQPNKKPRCFERG